MRMNMNNMNMNARDVNPQGKAPSCSDSESKSRLLEKIQALSFAKTETELYLDAHPEASAALEYYRDLIKRLATVTEIYEEKYGPLTAMMAAGDTWRWVEGKWPWQYDTEED